MNDPEKKDQLSSPSGSSEDTALTEIATSQPVAFTGQPDDLHDLFAVTPNFEGPDDEDPLAALRNDPNYSALIRDLEYIATQARLLFEPAEEAPSDKVWDNIKTQLPKLEEAEE
jgi:hypothetical protein